MANPEQNPKEQCKLVLTRSKRKEVLVGYELVEGVVQDVSDDEEVVGENKEKKMSV